MGNYGRLTAIAWIVGLMIAAPDWAEADPIRCLIVYPQECAGAAAAWKEHRTTFTGNCYPASQFEVSDLDVDLLPRDENGRLQASAVRDAIMAEFAGNAPPQYVVILGGPGSVPYGSPEADETVSDDAYVDVDGDDLPDATIGRIPARTASEATDYVAKLVAYDAVSWLYGDGGRWIDDVVVTAYDIDHVGGYGSGVVEGHSIRSNVSQVLGEVLGDAVRECGAVTVGYGSIVPEGGNARRAFVTDATAAGAGLWLVHGTVSWRDDLVRFLTDTTDQPANDNQVDMSLFENEGKLPVLVAPTCLVGNFGTGESTEQVLGKLLLHSTRGVIAAVAPVSPVSLRGANVVANEIVREWSKVPVCGTYRSGADAVRVAKRAVIPLGGWDALTARAMHYYGDPTAKMPAWGKFIEIAGVEGWPTVFPNQWRKFRVHFVDPALPMSLQSQHTYDWHASSGTLCWAPSDPQLGCWPQQDDSWPPEVWFRCKPTNGCVGPITIRATVKQGKIGQPWDLYECNRADSLFNVELKVPGGGGCPVVQVFKNGQWTDKNSVLGKASYVAEALVHEDWYDIQETAGAATSPVIQFRVKEATEGERSSLDFAELWIVDHPTGTEVWTSQKGARWSGSGVVKPTVARIKNGPSLMPELETSGDGNTIVVDKRDSLLVVFADTTLPATSQALLVLDGGGKPNLLTWQDVQDYHRGIKIDPASSVGGGDLVMCREQLAPAVVDSPLVVRGDGVADTVVFSVGEYHELDRIGLIEGATPWTPKTVKPLVLATHSADGTVTSAVGTVGGAASTIDFGEYVQLQFGYPALPAGVTREMVLRVRGSYARTGVGLQDEEEEISWRWGFRKVAPNPGIGNVLMSFDRAGGELCRLTVYDAGGRCVRTLCEDVGTRGTAFVNWNGRNDAGKRVASGVYFLRLSEGTRSEEKKVVLLR